MTINPNYITQINTLQQCEFIILYLRNLIMNNMIFCCPGIIVKISCTNIIKV